MINIKRCGFTLSETLITLAIVGAIAILTVPGLIKDATDKSRMALIQSTIASLDSAIQNEITRTGAITMTETKLTDPYEFLKTMDYISVEHGMDAFGDPVKKFIAGGEKVLAVSGTFKTASAKLKNGATVAIYCPDGTCNAGAFGMYLDVNGSEGPNIIGIDAFTDLTICNKTRTNHFHSPHIGDILGCNPNGTGDYNCNKKGRYCYCLLEASGFDPKYYEHEPVITKANNPDYPEPGAGGSMQLKEDEALKMEE